MSSTNRDDHSLLEEELIVERLLRASISPESSFTVTDSESDLEDEALVTQILRLPDSEDDTLDIAATILNEHSIDKLQIEHHTFDHNLNPFAEPDLDVGIGALGPEILPFPLVSVETAPQSQVLKTYGLNFHKAILPYIKNGSVVAIQSLENDSEQFSQAQSPTPDTQEEEAVTPSCLSTQPRLSTSNAPEPHQKPPRPQRRRQLERQIQAGLRHAASVVASKSSFSDFPQTEGGWKGREFRHRSDHLNLRPDWNNGTIGKSLVKDKFLKVPYEGCPTWLVDRFGIGYGLRTEQLAWLSDAWPGDGGGTYRERLNWECYDYMRRCGDNSQAAIDDNYRGDHWASVPGVDRQSKKKPYWTKFHRDHLEATLWLLDKENATRRLIDTAASIFEMRLPMLAARVRRCTEKLITLGCDPAIARPMFGYWYNYCINGPRPHASVEGVSCQPHTDGQNLAIMMCVLFIYGDFDWKEKAWLVLWEAKLIVQLPIGVLFFYPSALFIHFNINIRDFDRYVVTTDNSDAPTPQTARPIHGVKGRGSIVFFNQASVFQYAELGRSVREAEMEGLPTAAINQPYVEGLPAFKVNMQ